MRAARNLTGRTLPAPGVALQRLALAAEAGTACCAALPSTRTALRRTLGLPPGSRTDTLDRLACSASTTSSIGSPATTRTPTWTSSRRRTSTRAKVHQGQIRKSGEPYLVHPLEVAGILAELRLDEASVVTGLLHDTIEDTLATKEEIAELFGPEIADLVDGVTKLSQFTAANTQEEKQAENFRKMVVAMAQDIRVLLVKLADRTHNMRTLDHMKPEAQERIAQETLDIYAPLANRLGIQWIKSELEDLSFRYLQPDGLRRARRRSIEAEREGAREVHRRGRRRHPRQARRARASTARSPAA